MGLPVRYHFRAGRCKKAYDPLMMGPSMRYAGILLCLVATACAKSEAPKMQNADTLTQRQRDSVIGASQLPGAQGISKAQAAQDAVTATRIMQELFYDD